MGLLKCALADESRSASRNATKADIYISYLWKKVNTLHHKIYIFVV